MHNSMLKVLFNTTKQKIWSILQKKQGSFCATTQFSIVIKLGKIRFNRLL